MSIDVEVSFSTPDPYFDVSTTYSDPSLSVSTAEGPPGPTGPPGPIGVNGTNGTNGTIGTNGVNGLQGPLGPVGPAGPQGPQGLTGVNTTAEGITYSQAIPATVWELSNPFTYHPDVVTYDNDGCEMFGDVCFPPGLIRVEFYFPMTGTLRSR